MVVVFQIDAPKGTQSVQVFGSWDNWEEGIPLIHSNGDSWNSLPIELKDGTFDFKFFADKKWILSSYYSEVAGKENEPNNQLIVGHKKAAAKAIPPKSTSKFAFLKKYWAWGVYGAILALVLYNSSHRLLSK